MCPGEYDDDDEKLPHEQPADEAEAEAEEEDEEEKKPEEEIPPPIPKLETAVRALVKAVRALSEQSGRPLGAEAALRDVDDAIGG